MFADGSVRNVTYDSEYKDLYWALRGGGNNFGIVTRFHAAAYPLDDMWGGSRVVDLTPDSLSSLSTALADFTERSNEDPKAQVIMALGYAQSLNRYLAVTDLQYSEPQAYPAILANLTAVQPELANTLRITNLPDLTQELNMSNPNGLRQTFRTAMVQNDATLIKDIFTIFQKQIDPVANASSLVPALVFQPMSTDVFKHFNKNGGNPLGLENNKTPLLRKLLSCLLLIWERELISHQWCSPPCHGETKPTTSASWQRPAQLSQRLQSWPTAAASAAPTSTKTTQPRIKMSLAVTARKTTIACAPSARSTIRRASSKSCSPATLSCERLGCVIERRMHCLYSTVAFIYVQMGSLSSSDHILRWLDVT